MITGTVCEYETEVVLDSEDEEMNNTGKVTVGERFLEDESGPVINNSSVLFKKRLPKLPCEQANSKSNGTTCGKSITGICLFIIILTLGLKRLFLAFLIILALTYHISK